MTGDEFVAACPTPKPRKDWDPPVWTFYSADVSLSIDVQASDLASAKTAAAAAYDAMQQTA